MSESYCRVILCVWIGLIEITMKPVTGAKRPCVVQTDASPYARPAASFICGVLALMTVTCSSLRLDTGQCFLHLSQRLVGTDTIPPLPVPIRFVLWPSVRSHSHPSHRTRVNEHHCLPT